MACQKCGGDLHYTNKSGLCATCKKEKQRLDRDTRKMEIKAFSRLTLNERCCLVYLIKYLNEPTNTQITDVCSAYGVEVSVILENLTKLRKYIGIKELYNPLYNRGQVVNYFIR